MDAEAFTRWLYDEAVAKMAEAVYAMMETGDRSDLRDSEWGRLLPLWSRLETDDKRAIAAVVERAANDSLSRLMIVLDDGGIEDGPSTQLLVDGTPLTGLWVALGDARDAAAGQ